MSEMERMMERESGLGYQKPTEYLHKDPAKIAEIPPSDTDPLAEAKLANIVEQIKSADLETFDDVLERLITALREKPELQTDPAFKAKFDAAIARLQSITSTKH